MIRSQMRVRESRFTVMLSYLPELGLFIKVPFVCANTVGRQVVKRTDLTLVVRSGLGFYTFIWPSLQI